MTNTGLTAHAPPPPNIQDSALAYGCNPRSLAYWSPQSIQASSNTNHGHEATQLQDRAITVP